MEFRTIKINMKQLRDVPTGTIFRCGLDGIFIKTSELNCGVVCFNIIESCNRSLDGGMSICPINAELTILE